MEILEVNYRSPNSIFTSLRNMRASWDRYKNSPEVQKKHEESKRAVEEAVASGLSWEEFKRRRHG